ncbi:LOW QUALITY PROTEIN: cell adhesion molecule CEACAM5-like [Pholidichthys leucotaenia]
MSRPAAEFYWFLNGFLLSDTGPELMLMNIQMSQSGNYHCQAFNRKTLRYHTSPLSPVTVLVPASTVKINTSITDILESSSSSVRLSCSASGSSLSFLWMNGSSEVTASDRVQITDGGSTLSIINVTRYDHGPFRCHVSNPVSNDTSDPVNLLIIYGPDNINLTRSPSKDHYDEGSDITLMCSVDCGPAAHFTWFLNGDELPHAGRELKLVNIQMSQGGNYCCQAFNNRTMKSQTSQIEAITVLKSEVSNVVLTPSATDVSEFNSSVSLSCSSSGSFPSYIWMNSSSDITASDRVQLTNKGATLTIINITRYDQGPFSCYVFNNFSNGTSNAVELSISYGPENVDLKMLPSEEFYKEGSNISLMCSAESRPAAEFYWFLNGDLLNDSGPALRLINVQLSQSGNYSCQAFNSKTRRYQTSKVVVISVLAAVFDVFVNSSNTDLVEFNSFVSLVCSSSGSLLSFLWLNSSSEVSSERVQITNGGSTLSIVNITRYDWGPFRCHMFNALSNGTSNPVELSISFGPDDVDLKIFPSEEFHEEGSDISLACSADSRPAAEFYWFLNGDQLNDTGPELRLTNIPMNQSGNYSYNTNLFEFSSSVSLSCSAFGSLLSFLWKNDSSDVAVSDRNQITDEDSTLTIVNATRYDQGPFMCNVSNGISHEISRPVTLFIQLNAISRKL